MFSFAHAFLAAIEPTTQNLDLVQQLADVTLPLQGAVPHIGVPGAEQGDVYLDPGTARAGALRSMAEQRMEGYANMSLEERGEALIDTIRYKAAILLLEGKDPEAPPPLQQERENERDLER